MVNQADSFYNVQDYKSALKLYNDILSANPYDQTSLYKRAICNKMLGNMDAACEDWKKIKELGDTKSIPLLEKYCKP